MKQEPTISFQALARIVVTGLALYVAWQGLTVLIVLIIAVIVSMALHPIALKLHQRKIPWLLSVVLVVLLLLIPLITVSVLMGFAFANQLPEVVTSIRSLIESASFIPESIRSFDIMGAIQNNAGYVVDSTKTALVIVGSIVTVIVSAFYLMYDRINLTNLALGIVPAKDRQLVRDLFTEIAEVIGRYIRGNLAVSAVCAVVVFIALTLLSVPFALPLAIFTGLMGLLPYIGPFIALIPAVILGLSQSPLVGLLVVVVFLVYQQIENTFIVPIMYNKTLNLSPALVFLSVLIGGGIFGVLGAFLALPVAASIPVLIKYLDIFNQSEGVHTSTKR